MVEYPAPILIRTGTAKNVNQFAKTSLITLAVFLFGFSALAGLNLYTYHRFSEEIDVAVVSFDEIADRRYRATLIIPGRRPIEVSLEGDEWQLDARMIKWTDWLTFLGESPLYRLDRISGRYTRAEEAMIRPPSMHSLSEEVGLDLWAFARRSGKWLPGIDAAYGSSVFLPMSDGVTYGVSISRTGLLARKLEKARL